MEGAIEFIAVAFRFTLAALFLLAGLSKLGKRAQFERAVAGYGLLPTRAAPLVAAGLPLAEIAAGLLLGAGVAVPAVAVSLVVLLGVFSLAVTVNLARGRRIDCGCFGTSVPRAITWLTVARNVGLAGMAATVALTAPRALALDALIFDTNADADDGTAIAALLVASAALATAALTSTALRVRSAANRTAEAVG